MILRRIARPLLASVFVTGGIDTLRNPDPRVEMARPLLNKTFGANQQALPEQIPTDPATLVKIDATVKVAAGLALAFGKSPRLASLLLVGSLIPTTLAGHSYWEHTDEAAKGAHKIHFQKNLALVGGLLIASADTSGKPSLGWRARRAAKRANEQLLATADQARAVLPN